MQSRSEVTMSTTADDAPLPGEGLRWATMPGHWMLARLGKRVLRPGGLELTRRMLGGLGIGAADHVVEFGPGLGTTAALTLEAGPASYTGVERDEAAARRVSSRLAGPNRRCLARPAHDTGLPDESATVVYAEAMVTLETDEGKRRILAEAHRLLAPGGRLGLHELLLVPDDLTDDHKMQIQRQLSRSIRVRARPLTRTEWRQMLESEGLHVTLEATAPMHLLKVGRFVRDEGVAGTLRFLANAVRRPEALRRLGNMWITFERHRRHLAAIALVATKIPEPS
jgi:SAM-dependent methyltransferase